MEKDDKLERASEARANEEYKQAHTLLLECLESAVNLGDDTQQANALLLLADNLLECYPIADDPFSYRRFAAERALLIFRELGDQDGEARALLILATVDHDRSAELISSALTIATRLADKAIMARAMCLFGSGASIAGNRAEAIEALEKAIRFAEQSGDTEVLADSLLVLGTLEEDPSKMLATFERMADLESRYRRKRRFANRFSVAASLIADFDPARATGWYNRCLSIARQLSDATLEGSVLRGLARIERARGNEVKADELDALSSVMCPVPDMTELIKAAESRDIRRVDEVLKSIISAKRQ